MKNLTAIAMLAVVLPCTSSGVEPEGNLVERKPTQPAPEISPTSPHLSSSDEEQIDRLFKKPVSKSRILSLYHQLQAGQTKSEVEEILGKPVFEENGAKQWYVGEREKRKFKGSPWGYAGILVFYDKEERLISAKFNPQFVKDKHIDRYQKKYGEGAEQDTL